MVARELVCIRCRSPLTNGHDLLRCESCRTTYPVVEGVPVVLPESLSVQQSRQTSYFDAEFSRYRAYEPEDWRRSYIQRIFAALGIESGCGPYLDVGVGGSGATVIEAAKAGVRATGCDLSVEAVARARHFAQDEGVAERTEFVACAAESLPFPDESFGSVSSVAVLEHIDDDRAAIAELSRVTRAGGRVWITVPLAYRYVLPPLWPFSLLHDRRLGHKRHYDERSLVRAFSAAGFRRVETTYTGHAAKVLQLAVDRLPINRARRRRIWWRLERLDLRAVGRAYGALQLHVVFERVAP